MAILYSLLTPRQTDEPTRNQARMPLANVEKQHITQATTTTYFFPFSCPRSPSLLDEDV